MNYQVKKEVKPNSANFCTHTWCWLATCLGFPCPPRTLLPLHCQRATWSPVSQTKQKPTGATSSPNYTQPLHTGPFSLPSPPHSLLTHPLTHCSLTPSLTSHSHFHTKEVCGPPLVHPMSQTQRLVLSDPLPLLSRMSFPSLLQCIHVFPITHPPLATTFPGLPFNSQASQ